MTCGALRRLGIVLTAGCLAALSAPLAAADNSRLNNSVAANVYTVRYQAGCPDPDIRSDPALRLAAQWLAEDILDNRSDSSTAQNRSAAAGYTGTVTQTVAINPALAINNLDVITQWFADPGAHAIMADCANTAIGVWSLNSLDRSVVVALYGRPG